MKTRSDKDEAGIRVKRAKLREVGFLFAFFLFTLVLNLAVQTKDYTRFVNPFIGTGGHTFPGVTVPFGFVQLSPGTRIEFEISLESDAFRRFFC
jgi:putative alpha-1,2-mannosidase